jgi:hypothetical protein
MRGRVRSTRSLVRPRHGAWIELWGIAGFDAVALQSVPAKCPIISGASAFSANAPCEVSDEAKNYYAKEQRAHFTQARAP